MLGAAGESGLAATGRARSDEEKNLARSQAEINRLRDEAYKQIGLEDKDQDNVRADKRAVTEEKRYTAAEERDKKRLDIETRRLENEGNNVIGHQVLGNGNIGLMTRDGRVVDSGAKAKGREPDSHERALALLTRQGGMTPQEAIDRLYPAKPKIVVEDYMDPSTPDAMGNPTRTRRAIDANTGEFIRNVGTQSNAKPDPIANKGRVINGPDGRFKSDGKTWVQVK